MIIKENIRDFHLDHIFDCGQCFRWNRQQDGSYTGIAEGRPPVNIAFIRDEGETFSGRLEIDNAPEEDFENFWKDYLDLGRDYSKIKRKLCEGDETMTKAVDFGQGLRILKQEKWETTLSFLISQNNNMGRIKGCIASLCERFGQPAGVYQGKAYYRIPAPEKLASLTEEDLADCRLGYRAKYLIEAARQVSEDRREAFAQIEQTDEEEAFTYLTGLCGVGPKVANCIMLFSMGKYGSFPIDVWVKQAMSTFYGFDKKDLKAMAQYAKDHFGPYGGFAQQYLFYYIKSL